MSDGGRSYPMTADTIARARAAQQQERARVYQATGIRITDEGFPVQTPYLIHCPRPHCTFVGSARTDGGAVRSISAHLVGAHMKETK